MQAMINKRVLSVEETADAFGVSRTTVFSLLKDKSLPSFKIGRRRLIPADAVETFIRARCGA